MLSPTFCGTLCPPLLSGGIAVGGDRRCSVYCGGLSGQFLAAISSLDCATATKAIFLADTSRERRVRLPRCLSSLLKITPDAPRSVVCFRPRPAAAEAGAINHFLR